MTILTVLYPLNALLMMAMPIALAAWLARKTQATWKLVGIGAAMFIGSQVVHIPLNAGLTALFKAIQPSTQPQWWHIPFNAVVLGLTAGLCEEIARYAGYRWLVRKARAYRDALMLGAGHGGAEAILLGGLVALGFVNMVILRDADLTGFGLTGDLLVKTQQQVAAYWAAPWYMAILGAVERLFALRIQVSLAVLVLQVFTRRDGRWLIVAIGYHLAVDALAVVGVSFKWPPVMIQAALAPIALVSLLIILRLRPRGEPLVPPEPEPVLISGACDLPGKTDLDRQLDNSKYV
jgi:uncharacterized membrane protein YhfC